MNNKDNPPSLDLLGKRLDELQHKNAPKPAAGEDAAATAQAMRMGTEFISGVAVGGVIGYFIDRSLDTSPIFLMVCLTLGLAAGYRNLVRMIKPDTAGENQGPQTHDDKDDEKE